MQPSIFAYCMYAVIFIGIPNYQFITNYPGPGALQNSAEIAFVVFRRDVRSSLPKTQEILASYT